MKLDEVQELHYITPIANVTSIMQYGLLSHNRAKKMHHYSVAMQEIQEKRAQKIVPGAKSLHDYVNLYFYARNPMLYKLQEEHQRLCVLRIDTDVLNLPGVVITDGNAASRYTAFWPSPDGLENLNREDIFTEWWVDENPVEQHRKKRLKCAEVLVPDQINSKYILGAYVSCEEAKRELVRHGFNLQIIIDAYLFFRQERERR